MLGRAWDREPRTFCFSSLLAKITVFWKYWIVNMIKTWIIPQEAFEIFGWTFSDGFHVWNCISIDCQQKQLSEWLAILEKICLPWNYIERKETYSLIQKIWGWIIDTQRIVLRWCIALRTAWSDHAWSFCVLLWYCYQEMWFLVTLVITISPSTTWITPDKTTCVKWYSSWSFCSQYLNLKLNIQYIIP